ncbi:MAG: CocE/NonD family hydrolase [Parachlamydiaceae bacterium]|nr:CocE/NonD family hydrolase [Parachlamydiaceae bacterium]
MKVIHLVACLMLCVVTLFAHDVTPDATVMIPMRDGKLLPTDIYLPSPDAKGLPCILLRSPAGRKSTHWLGFAKMAKAGFVIAIQDTRSAVDKEGKTFPFMSDGWGKAQDGFDTVEWLAKSPYTDGKIGTWGSSALGITQQLMAPANPPHLKCQYIIFAASSLYHHAIFPGGQLLKNQTENWLGLYAPDPGVFSYISQRPFYNDFWKQLDTVHIAHRIQVPAIHVGGWFDTFLQGTIDAFSSRQYYGGEGAKGTQKLVIGPWTHYWPVSTKLGDFDVPKEGHKPPFDITPKHWFDHYLKGEKNGAEHLPNVIYYVMGTFDGSESSGNVWRTSKVWPVPSVKTALYLTSEGGLQEEIPFNGVNFYNYNPSDPAPTTGGHNLFLEAGPKDQQKIELRDDVVVFTSEPFDDDVEMTGTITAKIFFKTDQLDTDLVLKISDVYPDGRSILITDGIYRLGVMAHQDPKLPIEPVPVSVSADAKIHQHEFMKMDLPKPSEIYVDLLPTSMVFAKGHSIRLSITSSNYPRFEKNMNVGLFGTHSGLSNLAKNTIYMGHDYPSEILLPVVRDGSTWLVEEPSKENTIPKEKS